MLDGGQAEVAQTRASISVNEDVSGLDVAVEDPGVVSGAQGGAHGRDDADGLSGADLAVLQDLGQGAPVTAFHDQVGAPVGKHSGVDQRDRVRVPADPAGGRHLPHETSAVALVVQRPGVDLDSHWAPQRDLLPGA